MAKAIKWNRKAFVELRNLPEIEADLLQRGGRIAAACGPDFEVNPSENSKTRARVYVQPKNARGAKQNAQNNTLLANLDAGR